jgi:Uma2 family endonuclease
MAEKKVKHYSIDEYLKLEEVAEIKSEYEAGKIMAMSGGTLNHGIIGNNINTALNNNLKAIGLDCIAINGDVRIWIEQANSFVYPDAMVICGSIEKSEKDKNAVINPILIVEVLSNSTGSYDRGDKFHKYCSLPSFKEYVLIDQNKPVIDVLYKEDSRYWKMTTSIGLEKSITLHSLNCIIELADIYRNAQGLDTPQFKLEF